MSEENQPGPGLLNDLHKAHELHICRSSRIVGCLSLTFTAKKE